MAYAKQVWRDSETGGTPITAARLNHMEDGIEENSQNWDSISPVVLFSNDSPVMGNDVTLSESAANFSSIVIEYVDVGNVSGYCEVFDPNGKIVSLTISKFASENWFTINSRVIQIRADYITTYVLNGIRVTGQVNAKTGESDRRGVIAIKRVIGKY